MQLPGELLRSLQQVKGFDEVSFKAVHESGKQVTSIRINPKKISEAQIAPSFSSVNCQLSPVPWCKGGYYLSQRPSFILDPFIHSGAYYVQEASSMFLWHVLESVTDKQRHKLALDLCAAPGGKTTLLSSFFDDGLVVSNEVIRSRSNILQENVTKWGNENVVVTNNDSRDFKKLEGFFDVIVTDVPCSGSGLFRKDPAAMEEWSPDNVNLCCQRQQRILADIIPCLKENGILIYSTCSYSKEEDEDILDWIVDEFKLEPLKVNVLDEWNIVESASPVNAATGYRFFPDKLEGEGFFIAAFRQVNDTGTRKHKQADITVVTKKEKELLDGLIDTDPSFTVFKHGERFNIFPAAFINTLEMIMNHLYIKQAGISTGSFKGKSFVPEHALALSNIKTGFPAVELDKGSALSYLRKQDIQITAPQGWYLVTYGGLGLGWIKNLPNRTNNYYPSEWRILKS
jgi:16S rRNA C967 or C1407 C5-methylase (RsmB/RsmF family)/NOL1/NOP2/fmu family ribosome biogenesis protein